jgi:hypothetical protein
MSIINEALKKTEEGIQKNTTKENQLGTIRPTPKPFLLYILILLAGLFLGNFIFDQLNHKIKTTHLPKKVMNSPIAQQPTALAPPPVKAALPLKEKEHPATETIFILNGIFFSDQGGYALVNNQIVRESDSVDGAKVERITANTVELNNAGKLITLATQR